MTASLLATLLALALVAFSAPAALGQGERPEPIEPVEQPDEPDRSEHRAERLVVNGTPIGIDDRPWQVRVSSSDTFGNRDRCGGSILATDLVVTAAHCVDRASAEHSVSVVAGSTQADWQQGQWSLAREIVRFSSYWRDDDIALIKLATPLVFGPTVQPIELASAEEIAAGEGGPGVVSGWGHRDDEGSPAPTLLTGIVTLAEDAYCETQAAADAAVFHPDREMCTHGYDSGQTACYGDSGGPLVIEVAGVYKQAGVTSRGPACDVRITVYTDVSYYRAWIDAHRSAVEPTPGSGTLVGWAWDDANLNGRQDPGEAGLGGVAVNLLRVGPQGSTTVDELETPATGTFTFDDIVPGWYEVTAGPAYGYWETWSDIGVDESLDSDATRDLGGYLLIEAGETVTHIDLGYRRAAVFDLAVFADDDRDGLFDGSLFWTPSGTEWRVRDAATDEVVLTVIDQFEVIVDPGTYYVEWYDALDQPLTIANVADDDYGDSDINPFTRRSADITIELGEEVRLMVGLMPFGSDPLIAGDVNCDGVRDIGDALVIAQHEVGIRAASTTCPAGPDGVYIYGGDLNSDERIDIADALIVARCEVGHPTPAICPA